MEIEDLWEKGLVVSVAMGEEGYRQCREMHTYILSLHLSVT